MCICLCSRACVCVCVCLKKHNLLSQKATVIIKKTLLENNLFLQNTQMSFVLFYTFVLKLIVIYKCFKSRFRSPVKQAQKNINMFTSCSISRFTFLYFTSDHQTLEADSKIGRIKKSTLSKGDNKKWLNYDIQDRLRSSNIQDSFHPEHY